MMQKGDSLPQVEKQVDQTRIEQYASASGDFNPIHIDQEFATQTQFGGTIAHGMMVAATISEIMTSAFGSGLGPVRQDENQVPLTGQARPDRDCRRAVCRKSLLKATPVVLSWSVTVVKDDGEVAISGQTEVTVTA